MERRARLNLLEKVVYPPKWVRILVYCTKELVCAIYTCFLFSPPSHEQVENPSRLKNVERKRMNITRREEEKD